MNTEPTEREEAPTLDELRKLINLFKPTTLGASLMHGYAAQLLSLLDSQKYEVNEVDAERLADYHKIGSMPAIVKSVDYGATTLPECVEMAVDRWYQRGRREGASDAATRMRERCVERVKVMAAEYYKEAQETRDYERGATLGAVGSALDEAASELESLTLDGEKE